MNEKIKGLLISTLTTLVIMSVYMYISLPAINVKALEFWITLLIGMFIFTMTLWAYRANTYGRGVDDFFGLKILVGAMVFIFAGTILYDFTGSSIFTSSKKANIVEIETKDFYKDFTLSSPEKIPMLDRDTASNLGSRKLGELDELVSQYTPSEEYTQVNIKGEPYRVTPLQYEGFFKWLNNRDEGIGHYLKIDMYDGKSELVKLENNMKYSYSEYFNRDLNRHLRFKYPTSMFGKPSFEVDDEGKPYYIATVYENLFRFSGKNAKGLLVVDPVDGSIEEYDLDNVPEWVDRVQSAKILQEQINWNLRLQKGFFNTIFGKIGVRQLTEGYNYIPIGEDIFFYSGVTSANSDASNLGFILVNMRTKDIEYYPLSSAEEFSAMDSAEGSVQEKEYVATFPLLLNLDGEPMYIMSLKDNSGLVKGYSLVDVQDYQKVYTANSVKNLLKDYYSNNDGEYVSIDTDEDLEDLKELIEISGEVTELREVVKNGNTTYFFIIEGSIYEVDVNLNNKLPFMQENDTVEFEADEKGVIESIELVE